MKQNLTRLSLSAWLMVIGLASFAQISNNATTIFLQNPSAAGVHHLLREITRCQSLTLI
jgi:hypothetical protein